MSDARQKLRRLVGIALDEGCGGEFGPSCPFIRYAGGPMICALTGTIIARPAPRDCPLRIGQVVVAAIGVVAP